jgi:hypothetical protein
MKKNEPTMRQINAVREQLDRTLSDARRAWHKANPRPSYEAEQAWERKHRSPHRLYEDAENKAMKAMEDKREALLFDARMGKITADELYAKAKAF